MTTHIIGDVHTLIKAANEILASIPTDDAVVFLGDYFDAFSERASAVEVARWILQTAERPNTTMLLGNHEAHYLWPLIGIRGSGWSGHTQTVVDSSRTSLLDVLKWYRVLDTPKGPILLTHAGLHPVHYQGLDLLPQMVADAERGLKRARLSPLLYIGRARGGTYPIGGILWQDWDREFIPLGGVRQIVGHTRGHVPRWSGGSVCIDTDLLYWAQVDDVGTIGIPQYEKESTHV